MTQKMMSATVAILLLGLLESLDIRQVNPELPWDKRNEPTTTSSAYT